MGLELLFPKRCTANIQYLSGPVTSPRCGRITTVSLSTQPPDARSAPAYLSFTIRAGGQAGTGGCAQFGSFHALVG
ncbi:hypothetical protein MGG_15652 [Pyricularia oryzae 70-15]|uniref:Uncharacterized protein n=3 Tax=Pyricularia oryzae TaxID=318829 RepID=G4MXL1_PYRO7|nr:uncharacterized protein MGG_15652 [Pyricularia oryzae 70-15]EHA54342.1 hypothetical protein MGG_15652 [Pyricularia oryzae 70-15]ELQ42440.1 hypothetical protein OOU_Y34scaffold00207g5 [Pyricularia oryzae Y34]